MSTNAAPSNVISMRDFERDTPTEQSVQFDRLLRECRDLALARLMKALGGMLDKLPDLTPASMTQQDRESRDLFVRGKLCLSSHRVELLETFQAHFLAEFDAVSRGKKPDSDFSKNEFSSLELSLVDENDFEETLRVNEMATRLRRYCDEEVVALDQRMGVLIGDATLQGQANPLSPQGIGNAYRQACRKIEADSKVRLVLLKLFDDHVLDEIRSIYKDVNSLLVERSILPKIRYSMVRRASSLGAIPQLRADTQTDVDVGAAQNVAAPAGAEQDFFALLQGLMGGSARHAISTPSGVPMALGGFPPLLAGDAAPLPAADLVRSLTRIQHGDVTGIGGADIPMAAALVDPGVTNVLRQLKTTSFASGMGHTEGMTLDIVIMLFDQIFDDKKIPSAMKGLIGRLQIPTLKVAIMDKTFFSKKTHPTRKFLDAMGELCLTVPEDFGSSSSLYTELDRIVQQLIDTFQEKIEVFDEMRVELERVSAEEVQRTSEAAKHHVAAIEQRERLGLAKAVAEHAINLRLDAKQAPPVIVRFLTEQWVKLLIIAYAKHGADSDAYTAATGTMDLLVWSVSPMQALEERRKLAAKLPGLLKRLAFGMQLVGIDEETRKQFFSKLMRCHTKVMNGQHSAAGEAKAAVPSIPQPAVSAASAAAASAQVPVSMPAETSVPVLTEIAEADATADACTHPGEQHAAVAQLNAPEATSGDDDYLLDDTEVQEALARFNAVVIPNPFGEGEIEVEEIDLSDIPGSATPDLPQRAAKPAQAADEHSKIVSELTEGSWIELRDSEENVTQARLSYISPIKGTYLFVTREGRKVGEYSLYQLAREFRTGKASLMNAAPLFDRAMSNLVGSLKQTR